MFISPLLDDPVAVLGVLLQELIHASGIEGHRSDLRRVALKLGFDPPMRSTPIGADLRSRLSALADRLGPYNHGALDGPGQSLHGGKPQQGRLRRAECGDCGYLIYSSRKWLTKGAPICPICSIHMEVHYGFE